MAPTSLFRYMAWVAASGWFLGDGPGCSGCIVAQTQGEVEFAAPVAGVRGDCPRLTFTANGTTVTTTATTDYDGLACTDIRDGLPVEVEGTQQPGGAVIATEIEANHQGAIRAVRGVCPDLTLEVGDRSVSIDRDTDFDGLRCRDLRVGVVVEVEGHLRPNRVLVADEVESVDEDDDGNEDDDNGSGGRPR